MSLRLYLYLEQNCLNLCEFDSCFWILVKHFEYKLFECWIYWMRREEYISDVVFEVQIWNVLIPLEFTCQKVLVGLYRMDDDCSQNPDIWSNIVIRVRTSEYGFINVLFWLVKSKFLEWNIKVYLRVQNSKISHFDNIKVMLSFEPN